MDKRAIDLLQDNPTIEIPYNVWRLLRDTKAHVSVTDGALSFGTDYGSLREMREAVKWYVEQLGGIVEWTE